MNSRHRKFFPLLLILPFLATADETANQNKVKKEVINGSWKVKSMTMQGQTRVDVKALTILEFNDGVLTIKNGVNQQKSDYTTDLKTNPYQMDQIMKMGDLEFTSRSIFRVKGDELLVVSRSPGQDRPIGFGDPEEDPTLVAMTLQRLSNEELKAIAEKGEGVEARRSIEKLRELGARFDANLNQKVRTVMLSGTDIKADKIELLGALTELDTISLHGTSIGNEGFKKVANLKGLKRLNVSMTGIDDSGVEILTALENLEEFHMLGSKITDKCIGSLVKLKKLNVVGISETQISEKGKARLLKAFPQIRFD